MKFGINNNNPKQLLLVWLAISSTGNTIVNVKAEDIELAWAIGSYPDETAQVGDTITFTWDSGHNVHIHPTGSCDETDAIEVGVESPAVYTVTDADAGQSLFFACDVGSHCELGQHVTVTVASATSGGDAPTPSSGGGGGDGSTPSSAPVVAEPPTGSYGGSGAAGTATGIVAITVTSVLIAALGH